MIDPVYLTYILLIGVGVWFVVVVVVSAIVLLMIRNDEGPYE